MKKYQSLIVILFFLCAGAKAQTVNYGLTVGANLTNLHGNGLNNSLASGFTAGAFTRIELNKKWNLQPELLFNYANGKKTDDFINYYVNTGYESAAEKIKLSYISIPILAGYKINKYFTLNAGPQYGFLINDNENLVKNNKTAFKKSDLGLAAGAQIKLENLSFYGRYVFGVLNVNNIDDRYNWFNRQIQFGVNLRIGHVGKSK